MTQARRSRTPIPHARRHFYALLARAVRPRVLIVPPFSEYSVFYHRLSIDRRGRLFVSYDYWSTHWFYRNDQPGRRRTVLFSPDGGENWKLATTADLQ